MKHINRFNEMNIDSEYLTNILIDIVDDGFRIEGPYTGAFFKNEDEDRTYFQIIRSNGGLFHISDIYDSLDKLETYTGIKFIYLFEDPSYNEYMFNSIKEAYDGYNGTMFRIYVVFN